MGSARNPGTPPANFVRDTFVFNKNASSVLECDAGHRPVPGDPEKCKRVR